MKKLLVIIFIFLPFQVNSEIVKQKIELENKKITEIDYDTLVIIVK